MNLKLYKHLKLLIYLTAFISSLQISLAMAGTACENQIIAAAKKHGIPVGILYSVGLTETGREGSLHPNALNIEGKAIFADSAGHALDIFQKAKINNKKLIDLGCMQINHYYHHEEFNSVAEMLEPRKNVEYAAKFLSRLKKRHQTWTMAVARYHAGPNNDPAQKKYICRVISNLVATGYGKWTKQARSFCNS